MNKMIKLVLLISLLSCKPRSTTTPENIIPKADTTTTANTDLEIPGLKHLWDSDHVLTTCESVLYDKTNDVLFVSCINGTPSDKKDGDGFIAKMGLDGKIITLKWATGLNAPKGMGILGTNLLVTDIDRLVAIDLNTGKITNTWPVKGASLLNDLDVAPDGTVYFTDSNTSSIYALRGGTTVETVVDADTTLGGTNGVYVDGNFLMLAGTDSGNVWRFDLNTHQVQKVASEIPNGDGVEKYGKGWLVSNWNGEVHYIASDGAVTEILDSQEAKLNAADIKVIQEKNLLLVPTFFGNKVSAYELIQNK